MRRALLPWLQQYRQSLLVGDLSAGLIVSIMLVPQAIAYAYLAGLPVEMGLYASLLPLLGYALFGSSMTLSVGPVAITALMTLELLSPFAAVGSAEYIQLAIWLALISGAMLFVFGLLRLGFLANFLSHPVISGFISGAAVLILYSQIRHLFGLGSEASSVSGLLTHLSASNPVVMSLSIAALAWMIYARVWMQKHLQATGIGSSTAGVLSKMAPMLAVLAAIGLTWWLDLSNQHSVPVVGHLPSGLPDLVWSSPEFEQLKLLLIPALLISLVGFVESVSVAQSLGRRKRESISPNRELLGLGAANFASGISGGLAVCGGFSRSAVNQAAGANTPLAGIVSAIIIALMLVSIADIFAFMPLALLAVTIIVAVAPLIDIASLKKAWRYDRADGVTLLTTAIAVIVLGVEGGILIGLCLSIATQLWRGSKPHVAVVGRIPHSEHFRNISRYDVETLPGLVAVRIDENIFFANTKAIEQAINRALSEQPDTHALLLILSAVNQIDSTGLEMLSELAEGLEAKGIAIHLAEVKGPLMDKLKDTHWYKEQVAAVFLSTHDAFNTIGALEEDALTTGETK
ncbi:SulP family inorganic anion transporter [Nitrincola alkalilacustris]|uniref:SulP family inorganic anion transporter n=1 Tax=Nitrincola alkalilacustris TaxID=1571224 RepID=UPI00124C3A92|nr:sulfate permease [Nitrincola alkalilacustris]